jgi:hypothetical protein
MTTEERDNLLLELRDGQKRLEARLGGVEVYMRAIAGKLLSQQEIAEVETKASQGAQDAAAASLGSAVTQRPR